MASDPGAFAEIQAAAAAAYPLTDPPPRPSAPPASPAAPIGSPPAIPGSIPKLAAADDKESENEAATVTVPKDVLDRVRANPKAVLEESQAKAPTPAAGRPYSDLDDSAEPTKAVPREELLRGASPDGHVVIGADAGGEDATLAVAAGSNEASAMNLGAAIGDALHGGHHPPPYGQEGAFPPPPGQHPYQSFQGMGPPSAPHPMGPGAHPGMGMQDPMGMHGMPNQQPWSSGHMPAANPRQVGGVPSYGGGPMMQPQQQGGFPRGQAPTNWNPLQPPAQSKISGQMILLVVVGFVCLAIFVTGIVLFATTKF